eukprot:1392583-Pleurochrysis_carterae.AAC.1
MPKEYIVHLTKQEKRKLKNHIPNGHHNLKKSLDAFWDLKLQMTRESCKSIAPDHSQSAIPNTQTAPRGLEYTSARSSH